MHQVFKLLSQLSNSEERQVSGTIVPLKIISFVILDTYISMVSYSHLICAKGIYVAIISTTVETENPEAEIQPAIALLGEILEMFVSVLSRFSIRLNNYCGLHDYQRRPSASRWFPG